MVENCARTKTPALILDLHVDFTRPETERRDNIKSQHHLSRYARSCASVYFSQTRHDTTHQYIPAPGWSWWSPGPLWCRISRAPGSAVPAVIPYPHSGNTSTRSRIWACRRRTARPSAGRKRDSSRNPVPVQALRKSWWALGTPPGAPRCSSGSGTRSRRENRAGGTKRGAMQKTSSLRSDGCSAGDFRWKSKNAFGDRWGPPESAAGSYLLSCYSASKAGQNAQMSHKDRGNDLGRLRAVSSTGF